MDLKNLPSRYTKVATDDLQGDTAAAKMILDETSPVLKQKDLRAMVSRPGFIDWNDSKDQVSFNMHPTPEQAAKSEVNITQMLNSGTSKDFLNGLGQTDSASASTSVSTTPASSAQVSAPKTHHGRKIICAIVFMAIGIVLCHIAHRRGWVSST